MCSRSPVFKILKEVAQVADERKNEKRKPKKTRSALFETEGRSLGEDLNRRQVSRNDTIFGN